MDSKSYRFRNNIHKFIQRIKHPWPFYKKVGGISATIIRADGSKEDLGRISVTYIRRKGWGVGTR